MTEPTTAPAAAPAHGHGDHHLHIVPIWQLAAVLTVLLVLTIVTVLVAYLTPSVTIAIAIATVKAALVVGIFMHLRWDKPFNALVLLVSVAFLGLFLAFALMDTTINQKDMRPEYFTQGWEEKRKAYEAAHPGAGGH